MSGHHCHAIGCATPTKPTLLMCAKHWAMVPNALRFPVLRAYRRGQCDDKRPSAAWVIAATEARLFVARAEKRDEAVAYLTRMLALHRARRARAEGST